MRYREVSPLRVGDVLHGFCGGAFGGDHYYEETRVEAIGADWVVGRTDDGKVHFASGDPDGLCRSRDEDPHGGLR